MTKRRPAVAGLFYESTARSLADQIRACFRSPLGPGEEPSGEVRGGPLPVLISPHAGYVYSGPVAAHGYLLLGKLPRPKRIVVIGPNHFGIGSEVSIYPSDAWLTPLGEARIDTEMAYRISRTSDIFSLDEFSHSREHSIEVQVPFLQYIYGEITFVPILMLDQSMEAALHVGEALSDAVDDVDGTLVVATTDFTHYEPHDEAVRRDLPVIDQLIEADVVGFYREMERRNASLCGYGAAAASLVYAARKGFKRGRLLKYATSGDVTGDKRSVVGYASIVYER
ncbi:MAG: AmmeMemoRadiSam system protein B [Aigarchaeota archaeon]|nr:AmmeMemoRadiSam system protein B [Aigarchaeota archaeon]MDW8093185.1 AmmeMemoRadiSam system protein B [Nitrososphaerota archaeon]